jgi:hypothetical protein
MTTKITVIYDNPLDPAAFEASYAEQLELAKQLTGLERFESAKVWPKEDGTPAPAYRLLDLYFANYDSASAAAPPRRRRYFPPSSVSRPAACASRSRTSKADGQAYEPRLVGVISLRSSSTDAQTTPMRESPIP